jgi:hypothetical protein
MGMIDRYDDKRCYCRKLGHFVDFGYCRQLAGGSPCRKIMDCWFETIPVQQFIGAHYGEEEIGRILAPAPQKVASILEIVNRIKQRNS